MLTGISHLIGAGAIGVVSIIAIYLIVFKLLGLRIIKSNEVGIVEKWWSNSGNLKDGQFIALGGEAGFQPDILRTGVYLRPGFMYKVYKCPLVTISQGQIGYVFARDGQPLKETQTLGKVVDCMNFQDTRAFLSNGGQKGPQRAILREGTYAFNLAQFVILTESDNYYLSIGNRSEEEEIQKMANDLKAQNGFRPIVIKEGTVDGSGQAIKDAIGIVTVHDGPSLGNGEIIAPVVGIDAKDEETYHNNFQNPEAFLKAGGYRGKQYQVIQNVMVKFTEAIKEGKIDIVPKNVVTMGGNGEGSNNVNAVESLLGVLLSEKLGVDFKANEDESDFVKKMKQDIYDKMNEKKDETENKEVSAEIVQEPKVVTSEIVEEVKPKEYTSITPNNKGRKR